MRFELVFVTPVEKQEGTIRKFHFQSMDKAIRASLLAGPWANATIITRGEIDGVPISEPVTLKLALVETKHGTVLRPNGIRLFAEGEAVPYFVNGEPHIGPDGKPRMCLKVFKYSIETDGFRDRVSEMSSRDIVDGSNVVEFCNKLDQVKGWDPFLPGNLVECFQTVKREPFAFRFGTIITHRKGAKKQAINLSASLIGEVDDQGVLHVAILGSSLGSCVSHFMFGEISENADRVLWSKDLCNEHGLNGVENEPDLMSMFFKDGELLRIYLHINNPGLLIELFKDAAHSISK